MNKFSILLLFLSSIVFCQNDINFHFTALEKENGLPGSQVNRVIQDNLGFLWIATTSGLARYDGYNNMKTFNSENTPELYSDYIATLEIDNKNRLYIGTRNGGLVIHDIDNNTWKNYRHDPLDANSLNNDEVLSIKHTDNNQIWVGTEMGLNIYDPTIDGFISYEADEKEYALKSSAILSIYEDTQGWKWVGSWGGGFYLVLNDENVNDLKFRQFIPKKQLGSKNIWAIQEDEEGLYWLASHGSGLFTMELPPNAGKEISNQEWEPILKNYLSDRNDPKSLQNNIVQSIVIDKTGGDIWFGTASGVTILKKENYNNFISDQSKNRGSGLINLKSDETLKFALLDSNITSVFQDDDGLIWICSSAGLNMYNANNNLFKQLMFTDNISSVYAQDLVIANNKIWKTAGENGFFVYDLKTNALVPITEELKTNECFEYISSITQDAEGNVWCTGVTSLLKIDPNTSSVEKFPISKKVLDKYDFFLAKHMYVGDGKVVWLCTELGLIKFNLVENSFEIFDKNDNGLSDNSVTSIKKDVEGNLWVSSYSGLNKVIENGEITKFESYEKKDYPVLVSDRGLTLFSHKEFLYVGTEKGISVLDVKKNEFVDSLNSKEEILTLNMIYSELDPDALWGATSNGIFRYNMNNGFIREYTQAEGIKDNTSFVPGSIALDAQGNILFGNDPGAIFIQPNNMDEKEDKPIVVIQSARYLNPAGEKSVSLRGKESLDLNFNDYYLNLSFAGASYNQPKENKYAYKLEGFDDDWMYTENPNQIVYTNLENGSYTFKAKMSNKSGDWSDVQSMDINIKPALWQTIWFRFLSIVLFVLTAILLVRSYIKNVIQRNIKLKRLNQQLKHEISERESIQAELLHSQKSLIESNDELSRSNQDLEKFAHVASHDLKEPLRTIKSFNQLIQRKIKNEDLGLDSYMNLINSAVERMYFLIESILAFSSVDKGDIDFELIDLNQLINEKIKDLNSIIEKKLANVEIAQLPQITGNYLQLSMLFQNLITNALKFNDKEIPVIKIYQEEPDPGFKWNIIVEDNGIGISNEDQEKVFELFQRLDKTKDIEGTGLGLAVCNKIINSHKGILKIDSKPGKYCKFSVQIPHILETTGQRKLKKTKAVS